MNKQSKLAFNPRGGKCDICNKDRSLKDGICHECEQSKIDSSIIIDENGEEWVPGGYRL
jgi:hypothetical protein